MPAPSWNDLTPEQRCILYEGITGSSLVDILNSWVAVSHPEDGPYWNRKGGYVGPLAEAACSLIRSGLIEVWEEPAGVGEGGLMLAGPALEAVRDHENWWRFDPDDTGDPEEAATRHEALAGTATDPMTTMYIVITSDQARDRGLVRLPFWDNP